MHTAEESHNRTKQSSSNSKFSMAYLLTIGVILFGGFIELLDAIIIQIVSFLLGIIAILLSNNVNIISQLKQEIVIWIIIRFAVVGIISLILTIFYRVFGSITCVCWCCVVIIAILDTPIMLRSQTEIKQYPITFKIFVNIYEVMLLYLLLMLSIAFIKRLKCNKE
ncbi:unnamed protein product [Schistosoma rodhaini]|uniref:Uncharacterized protein n=1 Tax=Schistosoma rodhaini TaxID=6188 RepID=A0AA85GFJ5_9TREM|nr:unnamed protein product [Schistosoma rodhaini]